ncbi:cyclophilin-like fold protein [Shewanella mangrovi]|nr:cyclophilin-like fold protein [Shewanella mangrovi]
MWSNIFNRLRWGQWLVILCCCSFSLLAAQSSVVKTRTSSMLVIQVGEHTLTADFADNSSAAALQQKLQQGPVTIDMRDYGGMEKVGDLGFTLPRNDEQMDTEAGDIILYLGKAFVIYYDHNSWSLTRLARVNNVSAAEMKRILTGQQLSVTLSLAE